MRLLLLACCAATLAAADTVTLAGDMYAPFNGDPRSERPGSLVEIAKAVLGKAGYTVDYRIMPWNRTIDEVKAGKLDGAVAADPESSAGLAFPELPQAWWTSHFFTPAGSAWTYQGPDSLANLAIGIVQDYDYGKDLQGNSFSAWFTAHPHKVQVLKGDKPNELAVGMLARKRIELFIEDPGVVMAAAAQAKVEAAALRDAGQAGPGYAMYIGFSPNERGQKLAKVMSAGTVALRASGELATILARYQMKDWAR
jgi:polar amino acid transport system substrate-binding protein